MEYNCVDIGTDRCPCVLMEAGQCYACNIIRKGKCDCSSLWQGVCPYNEYLQRSKKTIQPINIRKYKICEVKSYSPSLSVLTIQTPIGFGLKCKEMGAFLMMKWKEWFVPVSVLSVFEDFSEQKSYVDVGVNAVGPKTIGLLKGAMIGGNIELKGPFYSGVVNRDLFNKNAKSIVIARGIAIMPIINVKENISNGMLDFMVDTKKLPDEFMDKYLAGIDFRRIDLEKQGFELAEELKENYGYSYAENQKPNVFFMVSPYYAEKLMKLTGLSKNSVIMPNHSNMCCGEGYCGSCSSMDENGVTVRMCKCIDA